MIVKRVTKTKEYIEIEMTYCCENLKQSRIARLIDVYPETKAVSLDLSRYSDEGKSVSHYRTTIKYCPYCGTEFQFEGDK